MKRIIIYVFLFLIVIMIFLLINFIDNYYGERVETYIENKGILYTQKFIQDAISNEISNEIAINELYIFQKDENDNIKSVIINTNKINNILSIINESLEKDIQLLNKEELYIPLSIILGENIFSNVGPNLKLTVIPIGNYKCDVVSKVSEYGINNSLFEISIKVEIKIQSLVPLNKIESNVECNIPIVMQIIQGDVPRYYYNTDKLVPDVYDKYEWFYLLFI